MHSKIQNKWLRTLPALIAFTVCWYATAAIAQPRDTQDAKTTEALELRLTKAIRILSVNHAKQITVDEEVKRLESSPGMQRLNEMYRKGGMTDAQEAAMQKAGRDGVIERRKRRADEDRIFLQNEIAKFEMTVEGQAKIRMYRAAGMTDRDIFITESAGKDIEKLGNTAQGREIVWLARDSGIRDHAIGQTVWACRTEGRMTDLEIVGVFWRVRSAIKEIEQTPEGREAVWKGRKSGLTDLEIVGAKVGIKAFLLEK